MALSPLVVLSGHVNLSLLLVRSTNMNQSITLVHSHVLVSFSEFVAILTSELLLVYGTRSTLGSFAFFVTIAWVESL